MVGAQGFVNARRIPEGGGDNGNCRGCLCLSLSAIGL